MTATVVVSVKSRKGESAKQILASKVDLDRVGREATVFRFKLDDRGKLVAGSVSALPKALRSARRPARRKS